LYNDIFDVFYSIYTKRLNLKLYNDKFLTSKEEYEIFKETDEDNYINKLKNEKKEEPQRGGSSIKKYKKILKKY